MSVAIVETKRDVQALPAKITVFLRTGRPWREPPTGWQEQSGGVHLGKGVWLFRYERVGP